MGHEGDGKVQSVFRLSSGPSTCGICRMSYLKHVASEVAVHKTYHDEFVHGIIWPKSWGSVYKTVMIRTKPQSKPQLLSAKLSRKASAPVQVAITTIDIGNKRQVAKVDRLLEMVNRELNAPPDSQQWKQPEKLAAKAYILVVNGRAIGIVTTDTIESDSQGRWMIHSSQTIVPGQINSRIKIGISRIWIAPEWRRMGLGTVLLNTVAQESIYGVRLDKNEIGFSQPSTSGGNLARTFNGVKHKSGEILIPVYIEQD